jgi:5-enolpyruvylshikimate-3-phosphate synthase
MSRESESATEGELRAVIAELAATLRELRRGTSRIRELIQSGDAAEAIDAATTVGATLAELERLCHQAIHAPDVDGGS